MRLSKRSQYAVKAAVKLAEHHGTGFLQSREIAGSEGLPPKFLESILLALRSAKILESKVGAGGGYRLAREPQRVRVHEVIDALENSDAGLDGFPGGEDEASTGGLAIEALNRRLDQAIEMALGTLTLQQLRDLADTGRAHVHASL